MIHFNFEPKEDQDQDQLTICEAEEKEDQSLLEITIYFADQNNLIFFTNFFRLYIISPTISPFSTLET